MTSNSRIVKFVLLAGLTAASGALAQQTTIEGAEEAPIPSSQSMTDWPCVQGKMDHISIAQVWDGPAIGEDKSWQKDAAITSLATVLSSRRVKLADAEAALKKFADSQPADTRDARLTQVFAALFDTAANQRKSIISGIGKYQKAQRDRAAELEVEGEAIAKLEQKAATDASASSELDQAHEKFKWASRIFQDRQMNIPLACELPVLIEERLYAISRTIRGLMKS